jgi:sulfatase maturation enzyme AslB (radical SAM superfamily)
VFSTFTRQLIRGSLPAKAKAGEGYDELIESMFLVPEGRDETAFYNGVSRVMRAYNAKKGWRLFTVLPTTACNARCVYCYEEGIVPVTMTPEIVDATVDFICRTKAEGKIHIDWFGGEPLLGASIISSIFRALKERGVEFDSGITTNATLLTPEIAQEAKDLWLLKKAQVSMDGARPDYAKRKNYIDPSRHNYDGAMRAVELLADAGVHVVLRCNYDSENLPRVDEFLNECHERFGGRDNVSIYLAQLFQSGEDKSAGKL